MKKRLSLKVLVPLILFTLISVFLSTGLAEGLTGRVLIGHFHQRAIALGKHINQEFYERYFNPQYEIEKEAFNPLAPKQLKELDPLIQDNLRHFEVERVNFFSQAGQVIYSTERGLVGTDASLIPQMQWALRGEDGYLHRHSESVAAQAEMVARQLGLEPLEIDRILVAGLLHDIGIIVLSDPIPAKAGKLTEEEMEQVRQHPALAVSILESLEGLREVLPIILHHHEHYAGGGYPKGIAHPQIPLGARILAEADAYHAMRSPRPFRRALTHEEAIEELRQCRDTQFDPRVVEAFIQCLSTANSCTAEEE